jgi:hypothetical protein
VTTTPTTPPTMLRERGPTRRTPRAPPAVNSRSVDPRCWLRRTRVLTHVLAAPPRRYYRYLTDTART